MVIHEEYVNNNTNNFVTANRGKNDIQWIVMHYTANPESTAKNNCIYYNSGNSQGVSAHYFVDWNGIWRDVREKDIAGHCGKSSWMTYLTTCRNANSIGIEMCCHSASGMKASQLTGAERDLYIDDTTLGYVRELVKDIMNRYGIGVDHIIRHYDVHDGHKPCPRPFVGDDINTVYGKTGNQMWQEFLNYFKTSSPAKDYSVCYGAITVLSNSGVSVHNAPNLNANSVTNILPKGSIRRIVGSLVDSNGNTIYRTENNEYLSADPSAVKYDAGMTNMGVKMVNSPDGLLVMRDFPNSTLGKQLHVFGNTNLLDIVGEAYYNGSDHWYLAQCKPLNLIGYMAARYFKEV